MGITTVHYRLGRIGGAKLLAEFPRHPIDRVLTERIKDRPCLRTIAHKLSMIVTGSLREGMSLMSCPCEDTTPPNRIQRSRARTGSRGSRGRRVEMIQVFGGLLFHLFRFGRIQWA